MNLKYRILWFEDDEEVVKDQIGPSLEEFLNKRGLSLEINHQLNGEELVACLADKNFDLIVTDLDLGESEATGDKLIDQTRDGNVLTEILLYSANTTQLNEIVKEKGWIERASFCTGLGNLEKKIKEIVSLTIRKNQDVNNLRGLVISETIILEKKIEDILLQYFSADESDILSSQKEELFKNIQLKKIEKHENDINKIEKVDFKKIKDLIDDDILSASNSFDAIHSILKQKIKKLNVDIGSGNFGKEESEKINEKKGEITSLKKELNNFRDEVLKIRNTLAHVIEKLDNDGIPYLETINSAGKTIKLDNEKYIEIRLNLKKHSDNLDKIIDHLK